MTHARHFTDASDMIQVGENEWTRCNKILDINVIGAKVKLWTATGSYTVECTSEQAAVARAREYAELLGRDTLAKQDLLRQIAGLKNEVDQAKKELATLKQQASAWVMEP